MKRFSTMIFRSIIIFKKHLLPIWKLIPLKNNPSNYSRAQYYDLYQYIYIYMLDTFNFQLGDVRMVGNPSSKNYGSLKVSSQCSIFLEKDCQGRSYIHKRSAVTQFTTIVRFHHCELFGRKEKNIQITVPFIPVAFKFPKISVLESISETADYPTTVVTIFQKTLYVIPRLKVRNLKKLFL